MATASPIGSPRFFANHPTTGRPLAGGKVYTYAADTASTPKTTWADGEKFAELSNPIVLEADGGKNIFIDGRYKFVVHDADDDLLYEIDDVVGGQALPDGSVPGVLLTYNGSTIADDDPGAGKYSGNSLSNPTILYISETSYQGLNIAGRLAILDDSINAISRAVLIFQPADGSNSFADFDVVGGITDAGTYRKVPVAMRAGTMPADGSLNSFNFSISGKDQESIVACETRTDVAALDFSLVETAILYGAGNANGTFTRLTGNQSARVTNDPGQICYIAPASAPTGSSGVWSRVRDTPYINLGWADAVMNGTTDDTAAVKRWVAFNNVFRTTGIFDGRVLLSHADFTDMKWSTGSFKGASPETAVFVRTDKLGLLFQVGDNALPLFTTLWTDLSAFQFECTNQTDPGETEALRFEEAFYVTVSDYVLEGVGVAVLLGGGYASSGVDLINGRIAQANISEDCIRITWCNGVFVDRVETYLQGAPPYAPTAGAAIAVEPEQTLANGGQIDTIHVRAAHTHFHYEGMRVTIPTLRGVVNIWTDACVFDGNEATGIDVVTAGRFWNGHFNNTWVANAAVAAGGYGVRLAAASGSDMVAVQFTGGHITQTREDGMIVSGDGDVDGLLITGMLIDANGGAGAFRSSIKLDAPNMINTVISGCKLGGTNAAFSGYVPAWGVDINQDIDKYTITGNVLDGSSGGVALFTHAVASKNRHIANNVGDTNPGVFAVVLADNVAYENKTAYIIDVQVHGGTVSTIKKNATTITSMAEGLVPLNPGESITVDWTLAPDVVAFLR